jgi:hypothetical protein
MSQIVANHLKIEIPEFENRESICENFYFKIYGIEKERPLIRINNNFYQGKWVLIKNFVIFTRKNFHIPGLSFTTDDFLFTEKNKIKIKKIKLKKNLTSFKLNNISSCKKLRLYRLPLTIKSSFTN